MREARQAGRVHLALDALPEMPSVPAAYIGSIEDTAKAVRQLALDFDQLHKYASSPTPAPSLPPPSAPLLSFLTCMLTLAVIGHTSRTLLIPAFAVFLITLCSPAQPSKDKV